VPARDSRERFLKGVVGVEEAKRGAGRGAGQRSIATPSELREAERLRAGSAD
jgi:hypothetical protein